MESQLRQLGHRQCQVTLATPHCSQRKRALTGGGCSSTGSLARNRASSSAAEDFSA